MYCHDIHVLLAPRRPVWVFAINKQCACDATPSSLNSPSLQETSICTLDLSPG